MHCPRYYTTGGKRGSPNPNRPEQSEKDVVTVCSGCGAVRTRDADPFLQKSWTFPEDDPRESPRHRVSHGLCPSCMKRYYPTIFSANNNFGKSNTTD